MFYKLVGWVSNLLYLSGVYFLTLTGSQNGRLDVMCAGLGMGLCALYFFHISKKLDKENGPSAKSSGLVGILFCVLFVALSCLGNTFNSSYALIQGGSEPRVSNSTVFLRWPWEGYSLQELNPRGSQFTVTGSYPLTESEPMVGTLEYKIKIQFEFAWVNEDLSAAFDSETAECFFKDCTSKTIKEAHKKFGLRDFSSDNGIIEFQDLIRNDLIHELKTHGFRLEKFDILTFEIIHPKGKGERKISGPSFVA